MGTGFRIGVELLLSELELNCKNGIDPSSGEWDVIGKIMYKNNYSTDLIHFGVILRHEYMVTFPPLYIYGPNSSTQIWLQGNYSASQFFHFTSLKKKKLLYLCTNTMLILVPPCEQFITLSEKITCNSEM